MQMFSVVGSVERFQLKATASTTGSLKRLTLKRLTVNEMKIERFVRASKSLGDPSLF